MRKYFLQLSLVFLLLGCLEPKDTNSMLQFTLSTSVNNYLLTIPASYHVQYYDQISTLNVSILYPSMLPTSQVSFEKNRMLIQIGRELFNQSQYRLKDISKSKYTQYKGKQDLYDVSLVSG